LESFCPSCRDILYLALFCVSSHIYFSIISHPNGESRETGSTGYKTKKNKTKTQRNWQHRVQDEEPSCCDILYLALFCVSSHIYFSIISHPLESREYLEDMAN
jgi:hypothetical protein